MTDLVRLRAEENKTDLEMTVLYRRGGQWTQAEINRLTDRLKTLVSQDANHPEYLILSRHYTKKQILKVIDRGQDYTVTYAQGLDTVVLPFAPSFA